MARLGRPPDALKHRFQMILEQSHAYEKFRSILAKAEKETFLKAFEMAHDRAYGKAPQFVDMDVNDVSRPSTAELDEALRSLNGHSEGNGVAKKE